jgi:hypothetical protein
MREDGLPRRFIDLMDRNECPLIILLHYPISFIAWDRLTACLVPTLIHHQFRLHTWISFSGPGRWRRRAAGCTQPCQLRNHVASSREGCPHPLFSALGPVAYGRCQIIGHAETSNTSYPTSPTLRTSGSIVITTWNQRPHLQRSGNVGVTTPMQRSLGPNLHAASNNNESHGWASHLPSVLHLLSIPRLLKSSAMSPLDSFLKRATNTSRTTTREP